MIQSWFYEIRIRIAIKVSLETKNLVYEKVKAISFTDQTQSMRDKKHEYRSFYNLKLMLKEDGL